MRWARGEDLKIQSDQVWELDGDKKAGGFSGNLYLAVSSLGLCLAVTNMLNSVRRLPLPSPARVWTRIAHRSNVAVAALRMRAVVNTVTHYAMDRGLIQDLLQVRSFAHRLDRLSLR